MQLENMALENAGLWQMIIRFFVNYAVKAASDNSVETERLYRKVIEYLKRKETCTHSTNDRGKTKHHPSALRGVDIQTAEDIQDALKDLLGGTIKEMVEAEMDGHLGYEKSERSDSAVKGPVSGNL